MFKIGFAQFSPTRCDVTANAAALERLLHGVEADLLVLPELANSGYLYVSPEALSPFSEPGDGSGPFLSALQRLAGRTGGVIVAGFSELAAGGLYNSAAAVGAAGVIQVYRKTHLFAGEKLLFLPGDTGFQVFEHSGARIGMMVCFDWFFPESARTLALRGAADHRAPFQPGAAILPDRDVRPLPGEPGFRRDDQSLRDGRAGGSAADLHRRLAGHDPTGRAVEPGAHRGGLCVRGRDRSCRGR